MTTRTHVPRKPEGDKNYCSLTHGTYPDRTTTVTGEPRVDDGGKSPVSTRVLVPNRSGRTRARCGRTSRVRRRHGPEGSRGYAPMDTGYTVRTSHTDVLTYLVRGRRRIPSLPWLLHPGYNRNWSTRVEENPCLHGSCWSDSFAPSVWPSGPLSDVARKIIMKND